MEDSQSNKIKELRQVLKLTQDEFAESLGISKSLINGIESKERNISDKLNLKIKEKYNRDLLDEINREKYNSNNNPNSIPLPYYFTKAAAGSGIIAPDYPEKDVIYFDKRWLQACIGRKISNLALIKAEGDSMLPDINDGDLLMIDDSIKEVIPNKTFVIRQGNEYRVKKLKTELTGETLIISNNPKYPVETADKETEIIGQVVWNGSKENV